MVSTKAIQPSSISMKPLPDFSFENTVLHPVCGIDEAGRGPLAGPVIAVAIILDPNRIPEGLNDSKKLSSQQRKSLYKKLQSCSEFGIGISEPEEIDRINILNASLIAMKRAVQNLKTQPKFALIDGKHQPDLNCPSKAIIKGDQKSLSIAAASIIAKSYRDDLMIEAEERFPGYAFSKHYGYPTLLHKARLKELGPSPIHRFSYGPVTASMHACC